MERKKSNLLIAFIGIALFIFTHGAGNTDFNRPGNVFSGNPRIVQSALRFNF